MKGAKKNNELKDGKMECNKFGSPPREFGRITIGINFHPLTPVILNI